MNDPNFSDSDRLDMNANFPPDEGESRSGPILILFLLAAMVVTLAFAFLSTLIFDSAFNFGGILSALGGVVVFIIEWIFLRWAVMSP